MRIGVPKEIKSGEARVGLTPAGVRQLVDAGHEVLIERGAGLGVSYPDSVYSACGAQIGEHPDAVYECDLIVKVKEIQGEEYPLLRAGTMVFGFQQLAASPTLLAAVLRAGVTCIAYETVEDAAGRLALLAPMSRIAGCLAPQIAAWALWQGVSDRRSPDLKGAGVLLPPACGLPAAKIVIIGAGDVGQEAARFACAMGCDVVVFARRPERLSALQGILAQPVTTRILSDASLTEALRDARVVIGAVLDRGRRSPCIISRAMLGGMRDGAVLVDVGIDQGGIAASSRATTHADPLYRDSGILHYCVPNIPALVAQSATLALTQATRPYVRLLADRGLAGAAQADPGLARGIAVHGHRITDPRLAEEAAASGSSDQARA